VEGWPVMETLELVDAPSPDARLPFESCWVTPPVAPVPVPPVVASAGVAARLNAAAMAKPKMLRFFIPMVMLLSAKELCCFQYPSGGSEMTAGHGELQKRGFVIQIHHQQEGTVG
jgi:hypothetical protein